MSWGATAYTPIVTNNEPPFGFHEVPNPSDFPTCNQNPWGTADRLKDKIHTALKQQEYERQVNSSIHQDDYQRGYDYDYDILSKQSNLKCGRENFLGNFGFVPKQKMILCIAIIVIIIYFIIGNK